MATGAGFLAAAKPGRVCYREVEEAHLLLTVLLAAIQLAAAHPAPPPQGHFHAQPSAPGTSGKRCRDDVLRYAGQGQPPLARRLDELPPGRLELTVYREVGGCPIPAVLQEGIGGRR